MSADLRWEAIPSGVLRCVGTVIWNDATRSAVVIDPTDDPSAFLEFLHDKRLVLKYVLLTHGHIDHAAGACDVARSFGLVPRLHADDWTLFAKMPEWGRSIGLAAAAPDIAPKSIEHDEIIEVEEGFSLRVIHTPGHTPGQVAYYVETLGLAVVGDTLFFGSVGRTDLPGGSMESLVRSIREQLYVLPDETIVVPGHGTRTTIGREKRENPYVRED